MEEVLVLLVLLLRVTKNIIDMSIAKALRFVKDAKDDKELRKRCVGFETKDEMLTFFKFDEVEFDDAINMQLVQCKTYEEAEPYQQLRMWFAIL